MQIYLENIHCNILFLPAYSPQLSPVELMLNIIKKNIIALQLERVANRARAIAVFCCSECWRRPNRRRPKSDSPSCTATQRSSFHISSILKLTNINILYSFRIVISIIFKLIIYRKILSLSPLNDQNFFKLRRVLRQRV